MILRSSPSNPNPTQDFQGRLPRRGILHPPTTTHLSFFSLWQPTWFLSIDFLSSTLQCSTDKQLRTCTAQAGSCKANPIHSSPNTLINIFRISLWKDNCHDHNNNKNWHLWSTYYATSCANCSAWSQSPHKPFKMGLFPSPHHITEEVKIAFPRWYC